MTFVLQEKKSTAFFKALTVNSESRTRDDVFDIKDARKFSSRKAAIMYRRDRLRMVDEYEIVECSS